MPKASLGNMQLLKLNYEYNDDNGGQPKTLLAAIQYLFKIDAVK